MGTSRTGQIRTEKGNKVHSSLPALEKAVTGITGLDDISGGGLPRGRTTIVCGGPGSGKTMLGLEFLVRGAVEFNEPGDYDLEGLFVRLQHAVEVIGAKRDALKQIRMKCPDTKVLLFSVNNSEHVVRAVRTAGAHGYLCKSNAAQDLLDTLKTLFEEEITRRLRRRERQRG